MSNDHEGHPPKGGFAKLVPELHVNNLEASLAFWRDACGLAIAYRRDEEGFVFLERQGAQIMLCQRHGRYETGPMATPLGQGAMFQIYLDESTGFWPNCAGSEGSSMKSRASVGIASGTTENGLRQFLVQDPDGYLIMFAESIGTRRNAIARALGTERLFFGAYRRHRGLSRTVRGKSQIVHGFMIFERAEGQTCYWSADKPVAEGLFARKNPAESYSIDPAELDRDRSAQSIDQTYVDAMRRKNPVDGNHAAIGQHVMGIELNQERMRDRNRQTDAENVLTCREYPNEKGYHRGGRDRGIEHYLGHP